MAEQHTQERWVGVNEGREAWVGVAIEVLTEAAGSYGTLVTHADLAEQVQTRSALRTRISYKTWIGSVLGIAVTRCRADGLPPLTSLAVLRADDIPEPDENTVRARLTCYRRYADDVPAEVIAEAQAAARAKELAAAEAVRERQSRPRVRKAPAGRTTAPARKQAAPEEAPKICPTCYVQLPASGICDSCD